MDIRRSLFAQVIAAGLIVGLFGAHAVAVDHLGGGGTNGGTTTGTTNITDDGYGNKGLIIGLVAGGVGGVALIWYLASRRGSRFRSFVTGCVQPGTTPGSFVLHSKNGKQQWLLTGNATVPVGKRVRLHGKRRSNGRGEATFQYDRIVKSLGSCEQSVNLWRSSDQARTMRSQLRKLGFAHTE